MPSGQSLTRDGILTLALDVNLLVYAANVDAPLHELAVAALDDLRQRDEMTYLFWPVAAGFVRIVTNPRFHRHPLALADALHNMHELLSQPHVRTGSEGEGFLRLFAEACTEVRAAGNLVSDAYIVALMRQHGVSRILTHDRDFRKFDGIRVVDPFA